MNKVSQYFGELTFSKRVMRDKLSKSSYDKLIATIEQNEPFDFSIANDVAHAMKEWAIENGATHFTHWFQPQRGGTAEKHDSFITRDEEGNLIERFSGKSLIRSEPDASSFPSGGMRSTFEARGYTAWDPTSPAFLISSKKSKTLVIPSVFMSFSGDVLDLKTPMLRSQKALNDVVIKLQRFLGNRFAKYIKIAVGAEQEYFLVSKDLYYKRPDLQSCGRTVFGASPAKGQQLSDHYFGSIKSKVLDFMEDLDHHLYKNGIPAKTRHNEVAPNQFEIAPLFEDSNQAVDHNLQLMDIIQKTAENHDFIALMHEKPFTGINGSGKHVNWSIYDNTGTNYLEPSKSPLKNISFLLSIGAVLLGINEFSELLRASIMDAGNELRLGGHEAPPAIISVYLGKYLTNICDTIAGIEKFSDKEIGSINLGLQNLPKLAKDISDRNRTSPFAFTGNKFEFRAVGSNQNCSESLTVINTIVAWGYKKILTQLKSMEGDPRENSYLVLKDIFLKTKRIRFEGNCYAEDWFNEAKERGLFNNLNTPESIKLYSEEKARNLFKEFKILSDREIDAKTTVKKESYSNIKNVEFRTAIKIVRTMIQPSITKQIKHLSQTILNLKQLDIVNETLNTELKNLLNGYDDISLEVNKLKELVQYCENCCDVETTSSKYAAEGRKIMQALRSSVDAAEKQVADELWDLPKYHHLLATLI
jgi:glutamine synthetase